jgi:signal transduction histidine kinase/GAF domain-containing protein
MFSNNSLQALNSLSRGLLSMQPMDFLQELAVKAGESLSASSCIVWKLDKRRRRLNVIAATRDVDEQVKTTELYINDPTVAELLCRVEIDCFESAVTSLLPHHQQENSKPGRTATAPMWVNNELIGAIEIYFDSAHPLTADEKTLFAAFANQAAAAIQKIELYQEELTARQQLQDLTYQIAAANDLKGLLNLLLDSALNLVNSQRGWISLLDPVTGYLEVFAHRGNPSHPRALKVGEGITGKSLLLEHPLNIGDVTTSEWRSLSVPYWLDTRSALAVPILLTNAKVRIGRTIESRNKPLGTLNLENTVEHAFSDEDSERLQLLVHLAAIQIDRLELERKLTELRSIEAEIVGKRSYDETVGTLMRGITETLYYDYVNISIVVPEINCIRSEYTAGIPEEKIADFQKLSVHSLDSQDMQADIVRTRSIEVPVHDDPRFDRKIFDQFSHKDLVRVILPMVAQTDSRVIGTMEAGYRRTTYRRHIYEQDIRILQTFLDYAVQALERRDKRLLETFSHEFRAPLIGLRNNIAFLRRRFKELSDERIQLKFTDMELDCEILLQEVETLEYFLGRRPPTSNVEYTFLVKDIIFKTLNQLKPLAAGDGFDIGKIILTPRNIGKIGIYVDQRKVSQVFYNLLINAIKYAEADPQLFAIHISVDQNQDSYLIRIQDWGIGVEKGMEEKIFEQGFRTPGAVARHLTGTGLGLAIARSNMREMGGDLTLTNRYKPTEFEVRLPKHLRQYSK